MQSSEDFSHQQQDPQAAISVFLLDHDGCLGSLNMDCKDIYAEKDDPTGDMTILDKQQEARVVKKIIAFQELKENSAYSSQEGLGYYIQIKTINAEKVVLCVGSNRVSSALDYQNRIAARSEEQGKAFYSGSRAPAQETLRQLGASLNDAGGGLVPKKPVTVDTSLLEDIVKTKEAIRKRNKEIEDAIVGIRNNGVVNQHNLVKFNKKIGDWINEDNHTYPFSLGGCCDTKIPLVYAHMHRQAEKSPDKLIDVYFIDDKEYILQGVEYFFSNNVDLIPSNVRLKTARYAPFEISAITECQTRRSIQGKGQVNPNIKDTFAEMDKQLKSQSDDKRSEFFSSFVFTGARVGNQERARWFWEIMREVHTNHTTYFLECNPFLTAPEKISSEVGTELTDLNVTSQPPPSSPPKNEKPTSSPRSGTLAVSARLASSPSPVASKKRGEKHAVLKVQKVKNTGDVEQLIDHAVNKSGEWSPFFVSLNFMVFSTLKDVLHLDADVDMALGKSWNILNGIFTLLLGITQLSDEREHRRVTRKLKGLTNVASGTQLLTLTAMNFSMYGGPALAASFCISFLHSLEGLYHRVRLMNDKAYWLRDVQSQLEGINEEITRLNAMPKMSVGFFSNKGYIEKTKQALEQRKHKLENYIKDYGPENPDWPPDALGECKIKLVKAMMNTTALGLACAAMVTACISPHTALPIIILTSAMFLLKNAATFAAEKIFLNEDTPDFPPASLVL